MQIIVCEDDLQSQEKICENIRQWGRERQYSNLQIRCFSSSEDFLEQWQKGIEADILFLDILFNNELNGMEIARCIRNQDQLVPIVFTSSSEAFIRDGYAVRAFRYLSKPILYDDVALCMDVAYKQFTVAHNEYLIIPGAGQRVAVRCEDVLYIEAQSPRIMIYLDKDRQQIKIRCRFSEFLPKLSNELFVRCHRGCVVNIMHVRCIRRHSITLSSGQIIPLSRPYYASVNAAFDSYYQEGGLLIDVGGA